MRLLRKEKNLFSVDAARAFRKLKNDMIAEPGGYFTEVIANAIDAHRGVDAPIEVALRQQGSTVELQVADEGEGFDNANLLAFHYMGRTTKRTDPNRTDLLVGRFGLGFVSVFDDRNGVKAVIIDTRVPGGPARRIEIRNPGGDAMPEWREVAPADDAPLRGTRFTFRLAARAAAPLGRQIEAFCAQTVVAIRKDGQIHRHHPRQLAGGEGDLIAEAASEDGRVQAWCAASRFDYVAKDVARIYLRQMLAEQGSAHTLFGGGGDKMAQNATGRPYLVSESIVVASRCGEPTISRDKLLRNSDFDRIRGVVNAARAKAVAGILGAGSAHRSSGMPIENTYVANVWTLSSHLAAHLEGREFPAEFRPAVEAVARRPFFEGYDSPTRLSLEQIYAMRNRTHGVFLHARTADVAAQFSHTAPVVLREDMLYRMVFGGWTEWLCADLLGRVFGELKSTEPRPSLYAMEQVLNHPTVAAELEKKGVICRHDYRVVQTRIEDPKMLEWFEAVRTLLNGGWFRRALSAYDDIRTLRLVPVRIVTSADSAAGGDPLAMQLSMQGTDSDEVAIGLRLESAAARALMARGTQRANLLPAAVQIASCIARQHFGRYVLEREDTSQLACTRELLIDQIGLEDRVIHGALGLLGGGDADDQRAGEKGCVVL